MNWRKHIKEDAPAPFDPADAYQKIRRTQADLDRNIDWPELLTSFLADFHHQALQRIRNATAQIDDAFKNGNDRALDRALDEYKASWMAGLQLYRAQDQEGLFP